MSKCPTCHREKPKTHDQRKKFHAMCRDIGLHIGETPGKVKEAIKADYFGLDEYKIGNKWYRAVKPSEQAERAEYADLITFTLQWAAENCDFYIEDAA